MKCNISVYDLLIEVRIISKNKEVTSMAKGSRYWADSYIVLKNGRKYYLEQSVSDIERQLKSKKERISLKISKLLPYEETIVIKKEDVDYYGSL